MERYQHYFAEQLRKRHEDISDMGWTNGFYVARAISSCFSKNTKYPESPLELWSVGEKAEEDVKPFTDAERFGIFAATFNKSKFG